MRNIEEHKEFFFIVKTLLAKPKSVKKLLESDFKNRLTPEKKHSYSYLNLKLKIDLLDGSNTDGINLLSHIKRGRYYFYYLDIDKFFDSFFIYYLDTSTPFIKKIISKNNNKTYDFLKKRALTNLRYLYHLKNKVFLNGSLLDEKTLKELFIFLFDDFYISTIKELFHFLKEIAPLDITEMDISFIH